MRRYQELWPQILHLFNSTLEVELDLTGLVVNNKSSMHILVLVLLLLPVVPHESSSYDLSDSVQVLQTWMPTIMNIVSCYINCLIQQIYFEILSYFRKTIVIHPLVPDLTQKNN